LVLSLIALAADLLHHLSHVPLDFFGVSVTVAILKAVDGLKEAVFGLLLIALPLLGADEDGHGLALALDDHRLLAVVDLTEHVREIGTGILGRQTSGHNKPPLHTKYHTM